MNEQGFARFTHQQYRRGLSKREKIDGDKVSGVRTVPDGYEVADIVVEVDLAKIVGFLGGKAMANKSGCSKYLFGLVTVRAVNRQEFRLNAKAKS